MDCLSLFSFSVLFQMPLFYELLDLHIYVKTSLSKVKYAGLIGQEVPSALFRNTVTVRREAKHILSLMLPFG